MPVEMRPITSYVPRYPVVDVHGHAFKYPRKLAEMVALYNTSSLQFPIYGKGSVTEASSSMADVGVALRIIKNIAMRAQSVPAGNNFAISIAQEFPCLIPTGTIHLDYEHNEAEVERLAAAGIRGIAFDSCWQGFEISDPRLSDVYRLINKYKMFVLTHTGTDPKGPHRTVETWPDHVMRAKEMLPDSIIIAAHLGANMHFGRAREYTDTSGILFDLAWVMECCVMYEIISRDEILALVHHLGEDRVVYGSDYPWTDPGSQISFWQELFSDAAWRKISHENVLRDLGLDV